MWFGFLYLYSMEENEYPRRMLIAEEIAWAVIINRDDVEMALLEAGFMTNDCSDEMLVRMIYDHQMDKKLNDKILFILSIIPYKRGCLHCQEAVREIVYKASKIH